MYKKIVRVLGQGRVKKDELLAPYTTFKIGGAADYFFEARSADELLNAVLLARELSLPFFILGGGSNVLISDKGFRGLVIKNRTSGLKFVSYKGELGAGSEGKTNFGFKRALLAADSGVTLNRLVRFANDSGWAGVSEFIGIPGTVGGAIYINAHFKDKFIGGYVYRVEVLNRKNQRVWLSRKDMDFGYEKSRIQQTGDIVLSCEFILTAGDKSGLWRVSEECLKIRQDKHPKEPSAGSVFANIDQEQVDKLGLPFGFAGYLIDRCGLKGLRVGGAVVSKKHANFIVNAGGATCRDVLELMRLIKQKVRQKFGAELKEEIVLIGEEC